MSWPISVFVALLSGALGLLGGGLVMSACVRWYRISSFEGKSGYAVAAVALLGGVAGVILGLVIARMLTGQGMTGFLKGVGISWGVLIALAAISAGIAWALADIPPTLDGKELMLEVELKLPVDVKTSPAQGQGESFLQLASVANHTQRATERGELRPADARLDEGRWVVPGSVAVFTMRGLRTVDFQLNGEKLLGFLVPLPARPGNEFLEWSDWGPRPPADAPPWPDTKPCFRFRVKPIEPPPPGPTAKDLAAGEAGAEQARFDAMDPGAPIAEWLPWTRYGITEEHKAEALTHIVSRVNLAEQMTPLLMSQDAEVAAEALRLVEQLPAPLDCLVPPVTAAGSDLAARIRRVNETTAEADPGYQGAADVSQRFSAWMVAVRTLREKAGGDFTPELREILQLARVRPDSQAMRSDVLRVASYWMHEWTGLEPLPTDPGAAMTRPGDDTEAVRQFRESMVIDHEKWHDGIGYDMAALEAATPAERREIEGLLLARGAADWRDVEALAALGTPAARAALQDALATGSTEIRLAVMRHAPDLVSPGQRAANLVAALQSAELFGGLSQALDEVPAFHPPEVLHALFRGALDRDGDVAVHFAAMLTFLHGKAAEPFDWDQRPFFLRFHTTVRSEREAVFRELCALIGVDAGTYLSA